MSRNIIIKSIVSIIGAITIIASTARFLYTLRPGNKLTHDFDDDQINITRLILDFIIDSILIAVLLIIISVGDAFKFIPSYKGIHLLITATYIEILTYCWTNINIAIWNIQSYFFYKLATYVYIFSIILLVLGICTVDPIELLGIKHIYDENPMASKTKELQNLYSHMRVPVFIAPMALLWFVPVMTLDRFLLASVFTFYLMFKSKINDNDVRYTSKQLNLMYEHYVNRLNPWHKKIPINK